MYSFFHLHFGWPDNDYLRGTFKLRILYLTRSPKIVARRGFVEKQRKYYYLIYSVYLTSATISLYQPLPDGFRVYKLSDIWVNFSRISVSRQMSPGRQIDERRSAAVSSSAEAALTIDTENFTADVTRKRKHTTFTLDFQMRNYTQTLHNREGVDLLYFVICIYPTRIYYTNVYIYIHSKWYFPPLYFTNITDIAFVYKTPSTLVTHKYDFYTKSDWNTVFLVFYFRLNHIWIVFLFSYISRIIFSRRRCNTYYIFCYIGTNHYIIILKLK